MQCNTMQYNATQRNPMQRNATQCNAIHTIYTVYTYMYIYCICTTSMTMCKQLNLIVQATTTTGMNPSPTKLWGLKLSEPGIIFGGQAEVRTRGPRQTVPFVLGRDHAASEVGLLSVTLLRGKWLAVDETVGQNPCTRTSKQICESSEAQLLEPLGPRWLRLLLPAGWRFPWCLYAHAIKGSGEDQKSSGLW